MAELHVAKASVHEALERHTNNNSLFRHCPDKSLHHAIAELRGAGHREAPACTSQIASTSRCGQHGAHVPGKAQTQSGE